MGFLAFLVPGRHRKFVAIAGWLFILLSLVVALPEYFAENNFLYPIMALLSVPFFVTTTRYLLMEDERVYTLSRAAVAVLIYTPFVIQSDGEFWYPGDLLISGVVSQIVWFLKLLHYTPTIESWNVILRNNYPVEIILGCTGIQSIAVMLGVVATVPTTHRQKILAFLIVAPTIYILNILRNVFVIIAYTEQWFPYYPEIAGNPGSPGFESFFWAHNVIVELLALFVLLIIAWGFFTLIPRLRFCAIELFPFYLDDWKTSFGSWRRVHNDK
jgi:archaeosortase A (PGF-CTERM-specific)